MKFLTPAFVRVENPQERKELIEWMGQIGIAFHKMLLFAELPMIMSRAGHAMDFDCETDHLDDAVNCGTNISLFKALAAMNDENDREQWFITVLDVFWNDVIVVPEGTFELCHKDKRMENPFVSDVIPARKATTEEIIEQFRQKNEI